MAELVFVVAEDGNIHVILDPNTGEPSSMEEYAKVKGQPAHLYTTGTLPTEFGDNTRMTRLVLTVWFPEEV